MRGLADTVIRMGDENSIPDVRAFADEVVRSLDVGDHRDLDRLTARAILGFSVMAACFLTRRERAITIGGAPDVVHVVANPVAHGARLSIAVAEALVGMKVARVADARVADPVIGVDVDAAGLSPRSMRAVFSRRTLAHALRLRLATSRSALCPISRNWLYREYLFIAQAVRYFVARDTLGAVPGATAVLADFDRSAYARPWIAAATEMGLRTVTMMHGSPNARYYVPVLADTALVWGQVQAEWLSLHSPLTASTIVGRPELEAAVVDTSPMRRVVVCHSAEQLTQSELELLLSSLLALRDRGIRSVLRLHPTVPAAQVTGSWAEVMAHADSTVASRDSFVASLAAGDGVIVVSSTSAVEALTAGYRVLVLADTNRELASDLEVMRSEPSNTLEELIHGSVGALRMRENIVAYTGSAASRHLTAALQSLIASR